MVKIRDYASGCNRQLSTQAGDLCEDEVAAMIILKLLVEIV